MVLSARRDGAVVYSISAPEVRDLLLAGRRILAKLAPDIDLEWVGATAAAGESR